MSYCINEKSAKHTYRGAMRIAKTLGIQVRECEPAYINDCKGQARAIQCGDNLIYFLIAFTLCHTVANAIKQYVFNQG